CRAALEGPGRCELCGAAARLRCPRCRLTYYCDVDHQKADWVSIHERICQLLIPIRTSLPCLLSEKERKHGMEQLVKRQKYIIDVTSSTAQEFVLDGKHKEAIPAALHALRFTTEVYGSNSVQLVPAYLLLAEASAGVGRLPQASKYLSQAQWAREVGVKAFDLVKQLPQHESLETIGHLLKLINAKLPCAK
ncbi:zinc finger MYND domain-containing protein 12, partial [Falco naumanni]|uniref:zinc finger MYND domain-containing protein 12 n=1 Tax=Falco naumanni TaxID=148594 RepID=UPI001ADDE9F2